MKDNIHFDPQIQSAAYGDELMISGFLLKVFGSFSDDFVPTALSWTPELIRQSISDWFCLISNNELIGVVHHAIDDEGYTFDSLAIRDDLRRKGYGTMLVKEIENTAINFNRRDLVVAIRNSLSANIEFVKKSGFSPKRIFSPSHTVWVKRVKE